MPSTSTQASSIPPIEQTDEYRQVMHQIWESRLDKAGLKGAYRSAKSELGDYVCALVDAGRGAYLWGEPGRGKTHAAAQAVRTAVERQKTVLVDDAWLITTKHLLDAVKDGYGTKDTGVLKRAGSVRVLALDDLGVERPTDWAIETLSDLVDTRCAAGLPTIVTSNYSLGQLSELWGGMAGKRIASRLAGACERIEVTGQDRRLSGVC